MVIQEALAANVPLLVGDIGGMAEKVIENETGFYFTARMPNSLAEKLSMIVKEASIGSAPTDNR